MLPVTGKHNIQVMLPVTCKHNIQVMLPVTGKTQSLLLKYIYVFFLCSRVMS